MKAMFAVLVLAVAGCASAPIVSTGPNEYAIGESRRDAVRGESAVLAQHQQRAAALCGARRGTVAPFDPTPPDGKFHFRCVLPPEPLPPPPPPERATAAAIEASKAAFSACIAIKEPAYDDGVSDASTVASALQSTCPDEWNALVILMQQGNSMPGAVRTGAEQGRPALVLKVVLQVRAARLARPPAPRSPGTGTTKL